jgi:hypothetical protein
MFDKLKSIKNKVIEKKASVSVNLERFDTFWNLHRSIAPSVIKELPHHLLINNEVIAKCIILGRPKKHGHGYLSDMDPEFIDAILTLSTKGYSLAYSYTLMPVKDMISRDLAQQAHVFNIDEARNYEESNPGVSSLDHGFSSEEIAAVARKLHTGEEKMFQTALVILYWATSNEKIVEIESNLKFIFNSHRINWETPDYQMLEVFSAAQLHPFSTEKAFVDVMSNMCAALAATRNPNCRTEDTGLLFGENAVNGSEVIVDLKALAAEHLTAVGATGSGKTAAFMFLLMRACTTLHKRIVFITVKHDESKDLNKRTDYRNVALRMGGKIIDIGRNSQYNINPLQILYDAENPSVEDYNHHFEMLIEFFKMLFNESQSDVMINHITETIRDEYRKRGIVKENPETWKGKVWPTLADLRIIWKSEANNGDVTANALMNRSILVEISWDYLNKPTNIDLSSDFLVIDLSGVEGTLKNPMNYLVTSIKGMRFRKNQNKETIISIDEGSVFLQNPKLLNMVLATWRMGRSASVTGWINTQSPSDLNSKDIGDVFKSNTFVNLVFGRNLKRDNIDVVTKFYNLTEQEQAQLISWNNSPGKCLLMINDMHIPLYVKPTDFEWGCIKGHKAGESRYNNGIELVNDALAAIATEHGVYLKEWIKSGSEVLLNTGFELHRVQGAFGPGHIVFYIKSGMITGNLIKNQTKGHYITVVQVAGYFVQHGAKAQVNHHDDVDVAVELLDGQKIAFEYEIPGTHSITELATKKHAAELKYGKVYFIGSSSNMKELEEAVGESAIPRGSELLELLQGLVGK